MKITGVLVNLIVEMASEVYGLFVTFENGKKVLYVQVLRALYGMLVAALLWYKKFKSDLEEQGFEFNPYDACVANKEVNGKQQTVRFHVDDLMSSHVDSKVNDCWNSTVGYGIAQAIPDLQGHADRRQNLERFLFSVLQYGIICFHSLGLA